MATKTHEQYKEELNIKNPTIEAIEQYINAKTKILHMCKICGYKWKAIPYNTLYNGTKCPVCTHKCIGNEPDYRNSIWASEYREYFSRYMSEEQMKSYMPNSTIKVELRCPKCGHMKKITPVDLLHYGFGCLYCSDGVSYPNKFARALVEQLPVFNVQNEYSPDWCIINGNRCRYDIYFEYNNQKYIVEMDGELGHGNRTYDNLKDVDGALKDKEKDDLAKENGINVIRIDSKISEKNYIKNNILKSKLCNLFNLDNINWEYCNEMALSSNIIEAARLWNNGLSIKSISKKLNVHTKTVKDYLIKAKELYLCDYSKEESYKRGYKELSKTKSGRIVCKEIGIKISASKKGKLTNGDNANARKVIRLCDEMIYDCLIGASNDNNIHRATMIKYCKAHNGFMYYDEWVLIQDNDKKGKRNGK